MSRVETIGNATLYLGDCREILPTLGKVDAVVTDPPYGIGISSDSVRHKHTKQSWDDRVVDAALIDLIREISSEQIIWGGNYFGLPASRGFLVWDKKQPEKFSLAMCEQAWWSRNTNAKIFSMSVLGYEKLHPTQKPVELMLWCCSKTTGTVLDPFMGSGTTGVACAKLGRKFIGVEMHEPYFDIACRRIEAAQRQADLFVAPVPVIKPTQGAML